MNDVHSATATGELSSQVLVLTTGLKVLEPLIVSESDRKHVAKLLSDAGRKLMLAAARMQCTPQAADVIQHLQQSHPGTNQN
jgi:hypothetical protein